MKVINAIWEKRNLGVDCNEIIIEKADTLDEVKKNIINIESEYTVFKVPTNKTDISNYLQNNNYIFIETMINCVNKAILPELNSLQKRIIKTIKYEDMNEEDLNELYSEIKDDMFTDDRVSRDVNFTQEQANQRYIGWMEDEYKRGSRFFKLIYKGENIGFFVMAFKDNKECVGVLAGIYKKYKAFGFGFCINYFEIDKAIKEEYKRITTAFSTNNRAAMAIHFSMNYDIADVQYIYIKHKK